MVGSSSTKKFTPIAAKAASSARVRSPGAARRARAPGGPGPLHIAGAALLHMFNPRLLGPSLGPSLAGVVLVLAFANLAFAVIGTLVSGIAVNTRARDLIGPMIGLPLLVPALIATARALGPLMATFHQSAGPPLKWLAILALYDLVFALLAYALFDFLLEE